MIRHRDDIIGTVCHKCNRVNDDEKWFSDGLLFLRVLAPFSAEPLCEQPSPVVSLNTERYLKKMDLNNLTQNRVTKRSNDEMDSKGADEVKAKKQKA